jgi:DMSO/TMAO reductase YedYZ molybdopterin-dependent catalytic subunit
MPLRIVTTDPLNAEAPLSALGVTTTPVAEFYIRNNFNIPRIAAAAWRLRIGGRVRRPRELDLNALMTLPQRTTRVTLECAGNGRALLDPPVDGTQWGLGAAGTAEFTGVALRDVLAPLGVDDDVVEFVFTGADSGDVPGWGRIRFQRSLPRAVACAPEPLLAWLMNGEPLMPEHGHPVRLVVPGWYAVASVKWLVGIEAVDRPFDGHFQSDRYVYRGDGESLRPVTRIRPRALITSHHDGERVLAGQIVIAGTAWSGSAPIRSVEVQVGAHAAWRRADVAEAADGSAAVGWTCELALTPGAHRIRVRATDVTDATQPEEPPWNVLGYGNNVVQSLDLHVAEAPVPSA